jgi:hypothetical protein
MGRGTVGTALVFGPNREGGLSKPAAESLVRRGDPSDERSGATSQIPQPFLFEEASRGGLVRPWDVHFSKGLILAQNERWRRGLGMQVVRAARPVAQG